MGERGTGSRKVHEPEHELSLPKHNSAICQRAAHEAIGTDDKVSVAINRCLPVQCECPLILCIRTFKMHVTPSSTPSALSLVCRHNPTRQTMVCEHKMYCTVKYIQ